MPHQCTQCGHTFPDGSKQMLSGCPDCGGNKFQFKPAADARTEDSSSAPETTDQPASPDTGPDSGSSEPTPKSADTTADSTEDRAQADARREVAAREEIGEGSPASKSPAESEPGTGTEPEFGPETGDESDTDESTEENDSNMATLRRELDDQFESIKILEPGQYELNLMELYNREEYIIALQEDGQYVIEVPETWLGGDNE